MANAGGRQSINRLRDTLRSEFNSLHGSPDYESDHIMEMGVGHPILVPLQILAFRAAACILF